MDPVLSSELSLEVAARVRAVIRDVDAGATRADAAAAKAQGSVLSSAWQAIVGDQSAVFGLASIAHSQHTLADNVRTRAEGLASDADALAFLQDAKAHNWSDVGDLDELAESLTFGGGVTEVAKDTGRDLAIGATWGLTGLLTVGAVILAVLLLLRRE